MMPAGDRDKRARGRGDGSLGWSDIVAFIVAFCSYVFVPVGIVVLLLLLVLAVRLL